ncbi:MAG TPA: magnesium transporter, partial [Candidatus Humimicrobiaceae bacterium]|nr:magnesium transporter [Candidatus Humimicrobiaceae bacterium]
MISYEEYDLVEKIDKLIKKKDWKKIIKKLTDLPPSDIAYILENSSKETELLLFRLLPREKAAKVFSELELDEQESILRNIGNEKVKQLILELPPDDRTEIFGDLPGNVTQKLLNILPPAERKEAMTLLCYSENSVGRIMTPEYIAVRPTWTIEKALDHIRELGKDAETINIVYVVDDKWHLVDSLPIRKFILGDPKKNVESIMDYKFISISADKDQEEAAKKMKNYNLVALPVVDKEKVLIGIVTIDDVLDVLEEETTEDFHKGAAVSPVGINYTTASPWMLYSKRVFWLAILLVAGFISSTIVARFQLTLESVIALAFFIPVLIDTGGNTSTQSATLIIRAISTGDLTLRKWFSVVKKELLVGLLLGVSVGAIFFLRGVIFKDGISLALTLGLSTLSIIIVSNIIGATLPILLTRVRLDPAIISSPLLTTIIDALGLL